MDDYYVLLESVMLELIEYSQGRNRLSSTFFSQSNGIFALNHYEITHNEIIPEILLIQMNQQLLATSA